MKKILSNLCLSALPLSIYAKSPSLPEANIILNKTGKNDQYKIITFTKEAKI